MAVSLLANLAKMTVSGTPGTGSITLGSAVTGFQTFAAAGVINQALISYKIEDGTNWEFGQGTYTSSGTVLARTTVLQSSAGGTTKISATSAAIVYPTVLASDIATPLVYDARKFPNVKADGATDDTTAINTATALLPAGSTVDFGNASYFVDSVLGRDQINFIGEGATFTKSTNSSVTQIFTLSGATTGTTTTLTANVAVGDSATIAVTSSTGFAVGNFVVIYDVTYAYSTTGRNQEIQRIAAVPDSTHITFQNNLIGSYATASTATITKLAAITNMRISGLNFIVPVAGDGGCIYGTYCWGVNINDCTMTGFGNFPGIRFDQSCGCRITSNRLKDGQYQTSSEGYGIAIGESSQDMVVDHNHIENVRENVFSNNTRDSSFVNNTVINASDDGFNTHGTGNSHIIIAGNLISASGGLGIGVGNVGDFAADTDVLIANNIIINPQSSAIFIESSGSGTTKLRITVKNNIIYGFGLVGGTNYGVYVYLANYCDVVGNVISGGGQAGAVNGVFVYTANVTSVKDNIIRDIPGGYGIAYASDDTLTIAGNTIDVSSYLIYNQGSNTNVIVRDNVAKTNTGLSLGAADIAFDNFFGGVPAFWQGARDISLSLAVTAVSSTAYTLTVPPGSKIKRMTVYTSTAYGASTSASITIGSAAAGAQYVASTSIKSLGTVSLVFVTTGIASLYNMPGGVPNLFITVAQVGTASATGAAQLIVEYSSPW